MATKIAVLGSVNLDFVVNTAQLPLPGQTVAGESFSLIPGGKGLNQAVAAARAGAEVSLIAALGKDSNSQIVQDFLANENLDLSALRKIETSVGTAHITVSAQAENTIVVVPGANAELKSLSQTDKQLIANAEYLVMQLELPDSVIWEAAEFAKQHGVKTVLTPAPVRAIPVEILEKVDLLVPNQHEVSELANLSDPLEAAAKLSESAAAVLVTLGDKGSALYQRGQLIHRQEAFKVEAIDSTAAGDTFVGALLAELSLASAGWEQAIRFAAAASAIAVSKFGATSSMPHRKEIVHFLSSRN